MLGFCLMAAPVSAQPAAKPDPAAAEIQDAVPEQGLFALLRPNPEAKAERAALRADRKAQRDAAREARRAAGSADGGSAEGGSAKGGVSTRLSIFKSCP